MFEANATWTRTSSWPSKESLFPILMSPLLEAQVSEQVRDNNTECKVQGSRC